MSNFGSKKYIGVDLGAWYSKKTKIAVLELEEDNEKKSKLKLVELISETSLPKNSTSESWDKGNIYRKNELLVNYLKDKGNSDALIGIDCPFAIPKYLTNRLSLHEYKKYKNGKFYFPENMGKDKNGKKISEEKKQELKDKRELLNPVIFDNSARFVYEKTNQIVLAPAGDKIGKMTARMLKIVEIHKRDLNIIQELKTFEQFKRNTQNKITTIEVFPTATIFQIAKSKKIIGIYFKTKMKDKKTYTEEFDKNKKLIVQSYKGDNWNGKTTVKSQKRRMLNLINPYITNLKDWESRIKTDDEYDAIICALTTYFVDTNGYEEPDRNDFAKFTNSFIYIPKIK